MASQGNLVSSQPLTQSLTPSQVDYAKNVYSSIPSSIGGLFTGSTYGNAINQLGYMFGGGSQTSTPNSTPTTTPSPQSTQTTGIATAPKQSPNTGYGGTTPTASTGSGSLGSYKGVQIMPGQDVNAQIAAINAKQNGQQVASASYSAPPMQPIPPVQTNVDAIGYNPQTGTAPQASNNVYGNSQYGGILGQYTGTAASGAGGINNATTQGQTNIMTAANNNPAVLAAIQKITDLTNQNAAQLTNISNTGQPDYTQAGNAANANAQYQRELTAAQTNLANVLQEQGIQVGAAENAGQLGQTGANLAGQMTTGAVANAAGLAAPQPYGLTTQPYNPASDTYGGGGTGGVLGRANLAGQIAGAQTVGATQGGIQSQQTQQVAGWTSALQQGKNLQSQLTNLITSFNIDPSNINAANSALQTIARNTSNPYYQQYQNYINDVANTYAQVLTPAGGSQTDTSRGIATSMLDASMSGQGIISTMQQLDNAAQAKIAGVPTTGTSNTSGSSTSGFAW